MVAPGNMFWDVSEGQSASDELCEQANQVCEVSFVRGGMSRIGIGMGGFGTG